ncbi:MAG: glycosyltransferase family 2 protein [Bacteroidetes bacterium]|nr:glycosyltransferase family 2 protein [Bacteroidota bacterium]
MPGTVSAIVIHFGKLAYTEHLVRQLLALDTVSEIVVVDNAAEQVFPADAFPSVRLVRLSENGGYGHACNRGVNAADGDYFFILNNDLDLTNDPLPALLVAMEAQPRAGAAGPALRHPDGRFQLSFGERPTLRSELRERQRQQQSREGGGTLIEARAREAAVPLEPHWITGACMLIRRAAWEAVSGFDEAYFFYFEDVDICSRLGRAGWKVLYRPETEIVHFGGGSDPLSNPRIVVSYRREQLRYYARYNSRLSYFLLQRYLLWKFTRMLRGGAIDASLAAELRALIRTFPFREEHRALSMKEKR